MKIGIEINSYECPIKDQIMFMKSHGFEATFCFSNEPQLEEIMNLCKENGIEVENYHAPFSHINDIWADIHEGDKMLQEILDGVDACKKYGVHTLIVHLGSAVVTDIGLSRLDNLMSYANENSVTIAFENLSVLGNLACAFERYKEAGFCWDTGHEKAYTHGRQYMPLFGDRLAAIHVHDNHCIHKGDVHMIPFDAHIDFDRVTTQLAEANYQKALMLETMAHRYQPYFDMGPDEYYKRAAKAAKRLADEVERKRALM